jgi:hypothetical protein
VPRSTPFDDDGFGATTATAHFLKKGGGHALVIAESPNPGPPPLRTHP